MEILKNMQKVSLFECALVATLTRSYIVGPAISDALIIVTLVGVLAYVKEYLNKEQVKTATELKKEIELIKNQLSTISLDRGVRKISTSVAELENVRRF